MSLFVLEELEGLPGASVAVRAKYRDSSASLGMTVRWIGNQSGHDMMGEARLRPEPSGLMRRSDNKPSGPASKESSFGEDIRRESTEICGHFGCPVGR